LAFCFAINAPSLAQAQSAADYARLSEGMKRLEARVAALESENKQAKKETAAARAEADVLRRKVEAERQPRARRPSAPIPTSTVAAIGATPGTLANTRVNLAGSGTDLSTTTFFFPPAPPAPPGISTSAFSFTDTLDNRWMVSALARAGALIDPNDLVYVIGGYTYGRFENIDGGFGLNGGTVGVGWERQIVPGWTLRGEYRYTRFQDTDLHVNTQSASSDGSSTTTFNTSQITHYSGLDMHSLWLGVSHYFWMN
jgi:opacity protein-like surface antigen